MKVVRETLLVLGASAVVGACASAGAAGAGPAASLPNVACPEGVTLSATPFTNAAQTALVRAQVAGDTLGYQEALNQSLQGMEATPNNPQPYYLAGQAYVGMGDFAGADSVWARASTLCPAYTAEIAPDRRNAYQLAYNRGIEALNAGDTAAAITAWENASRLDRSSPDATFNLAVVASQSGDYERATRGFEETLRLLDSLPAVDPADTLASGQMGDRMDTRRNAYAGLLNVGAQRFSAEDYVGAGRVFQRLSELDPNSRDAWYNYALALYQQKQWAQLQPVAERVVQIDPLNENANVLLFNALKEQGQNQRALEVLERVEELPVKVTQVQVNGQEGRSVLTGTVEGNKAPAGSPVRLEFTLFANGQTLGTQAVTVNAPAEGQTGTFEVALDSPTPVSSYRYRVVR